MSFRHLTKASNTELAKLLIGAAKAIFVASIIAVLYPGATDGRPVGWAAVGIMVSAILAWIGIRLLETAQRAVARKGRKT